MKVANRPDEYYRSLVAELSKLTDEKGDVNAINETIDRDAKTMKRLTYAMFAFLLLMIAALAWAVV